MTIIDTMMDKMVNALPQEEREEMMINMMPLMMDGIDMNELMPRMMSSMLKDVTADDLINYLKDTLKDKEKIQELGTKIQEANLMGQMMFRVDTGKLNFEETVSSLIESARQNGWLIPDTRDIQHEYHEAGLNEMTKCTIIYFCNPQGGYAIFTSNDTNKAMTAMMPMGVSVYETTDGQVKIAAVNLSLMSNFFSGEVKDVFIENGARYEKSLEAVI